MHLPHAIMKNQTIKHVSDSNELEIYHVSSYKNYFNNVSVILSSKLQNLEYQKLESHVNIKHNENSLTHTNTLHLFLKPRKSWKPRLF